ncbi:IucA/IucC family C-terminal-domain containing protein [Brevibacillus nitrificans]|uniref:IucA/IucC family C-terminal-domain containing protein n=1 Tax=Brevibacillus nitrificans TaxID=651560 RepID=UPI002E23080B|nr:IucA/IucC family C-terminal-domain containing protein [Brevibacillus nitrificans]
MKNDLLEADEWEYLKKHFRMNETSSLQLTPIHPAAHLLDEEKCAGYLDQMTAFMASPSRKVTASLLAKRYAFLTVAPTLYAMTMYNKGLDASIGNYSLVLSEQSSDPWLSHMGIRTLAVSSPTDGCRNEWRDRVLAGLFAENIAPVWRNLSKLARIPRTILWENAAVRLFSLYEKRMEKEATGEIIERIRDDFSYLVKLAPPALFGEDSHPFAPFYGEEPAVHASNRPARIRKTCCYYYQVAKEEDYCDACPRANRR